MPAEPVQASAVPGRLPHDARQVWLTGTTHHDGPRVAKHQLTGALRRLIESVAMLDPGPLSGGAIEALTTRANQLADDLSRFPSLTQRGGAASAGGEDAVLFERSGISGRSNPLAPPLEIWLDGDITLGRARYGPAYEGPPGCVHGGFVAAAFDDLLGCAQMTSGQAGFTGTLTVRMVAPTPLETDIDYEAGLDYRDGRKIYCWGRARASGELVAEAEGLFITPREPHPNLAPNTAVAASGTGPPTVSDG